MSISRHPVRKHGGLLQNLEPRQLFAAPSADTPFGYTDSTFGTAGHATVSADNPGVDQVVVAADGSIYDIGDYTIARFSAGGKLDKSFGSNGLASTLGGEFVAAAADSSNRLYLLVTSTDSDNVKTTVLARYTAAGQADGTYATGGSTTVVTDDNFTPVGVAIQSDGKIVVAGTQATNSGNGGAMRVLRVGTDGTLDTTFGSGGSFQANLGSATSLAPVIDDVVLGVRILSTGEILIGGGTLSYAPTNFSSSSAYTESDVAVVHLTSGGGFDTSFGTGGVARDQFLSQARVSQRANGSSYVATALPAHFDATADGTTTFSGDYYGTSVIKLTAAGTLGFTSLPYTDPISTNRIEAIKLLPDGRVVLFNPSANSQTGFALTAIGADGTIGPTVLTDDLNSSTMDITSGLNGAIAVAGNGQLVVGGVSSDDQNLIVQQLNASTADAPRPDNFANGGASSIVVGSNGYVNLAYYDTAHSDLMYVRRLRNGFWSKPITLDAKPGAGTYLALSLDQKNNPYVAYYDRRSKTLKVASSSDGGLHFSLSVIDQVGDVGQYVAAAKPYYPYAMPAPTVAYYDKTNGDLKLATLNSKGVWSTSTLDAKGNVGQNAAITVGNSDHIQIAYYDATNGIVKFAGQDSKGKYQFKTVGAASKGIESLNILAAGQDQPAVLYHDLASGDLRLSVYTTGPKFVAHTIATHTGQSAALAPSGFTSDDPNIFTYSKSSNRLLQIADPLHSRIDINLGSGGSEIDVDYASLSESSFIASFVDPSTGDLEVRPLLYS